MMENKITLNGIIALDSNISTTNGTGYAIMHMDKKVACVWMDGTAKIYQEQFMPYDLYLITDAKDIDSRLNNLDVFNHWCASRVLSLDRKYAKEILNSIGVAQAITDKDRAKISLSYHCVSLTDVYWVKKENEGISYSQLNLFDNPLNEAIVELSLRGRQMTVTNHELAPDLSTKGCFAKAWIRTHDGFKLLKDGGEDVVRKEVLASEICQCFNVPQVIYREHVYQGEIVSASDIITSKKFSIVSKMAFDIYAANHNFDSIAACIEIDPITYYGMNILDYLTGNTDRHSENWGVWVDNCTNKYISLYPLMDFNQCFQSYDTIQGARCLTTSKQCNQLEAAIEAVKVIGLRQIREMEMEKFNGMTAEAEMFLIRLNELKKYIQ